MLSELETLLRKADALRGRKGAEDIHAEITRDASAATNGFVGRQLCHKVVDMCHPKAWGDRFVEGYDQPEWQAFLGELAAVAEECGAALGERR